MRSTYKQFYYINRGRVKADGTTSIFCRITIDGKVSAIATGLYCAPEDWDAKKGEARNARVNGQLQAFRQRIDEAYELAVKDKGIVTAEILKSSITGANAIPTTLLATGEEERERLKVRSVRINSTSSYRQSKTTQLNLHEFIESRGMKDMAFEDITEEFGNAYKLYLKGKGYSASHTNHNLCWLQRLIYIAVDRGLLKFNPLEDVKYEKKGTPQRRHISRCDLKRIMKTPMEDKNLEQARRMFVFSCLTGLAYVDLRNLYPHHIGMTADGRKYIREKRAKTNNEAFIPLHPIAEQIMSLYNTADDSKPVFPLSSRDSMWFEFHSLGVALGINENLTAHVARHTFGVNMVTSGISMESVAKMMGHSNLRSTQIYAVITDNKISIDMDKLMQRRKTKETDQKRNKEDEK
ncbi:site-specific integrase [Phocaeicola plebeius]|uniref:site-specific integrase n=1 Tax=Phocaeicola plebeius TaxID=310297 RepID=UPI000E53B355|nr:site-specific integrase [Phocaeicola plebeius]RGQ74661.1 site-specific integrase [Phocaeicola plebeius]RGQ93182.1 site-specific integrase [Phocaeicola plebeius]